MGKELEPRSMGTAAALDQVKQSVHSDLQYISLQMDGKTYGGWYRLLADGRMELLALANMHCERRPENTLTEQARGMLADFVRAARPDRETNIDAHLTSGDVLADEQIKPDSNATLGDLLYADKSKSRVAEDDWVTLVKSIGAGNARAMDQLFERTHRIVYTLMMRLIGNRDVAEELTLDVYQDVWRQASRFDLAGGPVLAWLLNQARLRAIERLELDRLQGNEDTHVGEQSIWLRDALPSLLADERQFIEAAYFSRRSCQELATEHQQSLETVKGYIHSGLEKLRERLHLGVQGQ